MSSKLKQIFLGIDNYSNKIQKLLMLIGNLKIIDIYIYRKPIQKFIKTFLNILSFNQIKENLEKYKYDDIYHLFIICKCEKNTDIIIEKNEILNIDITNTNKINNFDKVEFKLINNYNEKTLTIKDLLNNTLKKIGSYNFFNYDSRNLNCQKFIMDILNSNNLMKDEYKKFIYQNPYEIYENTGILSYINKKITDLGATYRIIKGEGLNKKIINENDYNLLTKNNKYILTQINYNYKYFIKNKKEILQKMKENNINTNNYNNNIVNNKIKNIIFHNDTKDKLNYNDYLIKDYNKYITFVFFSKI